MLDSKLAAKYFSLSSDARSIGSAMSTHDMKGPVRFTWVKTNIQKMHNIKAIEELASWLIQLYLARAEKQISNMFMRSFVAEIHLASIACLVNITLKPNAHPSYKNHLAIYKQTYFDIDLYWAKSTESAHDEEGVLLVDAFWLQHTGLPR